MRDLYEAGSLHEAQMLVDRLAELGIRAVIRNEHLQGALGELPLSLNPMVALLRDVDWARARDEVLRFEAANRQPEGPERRCELCGEHSPGNFQLCWSCRQPFASDS